MGKQNKRVKAEAEDEVIFNTELKNKKQKKDKQQAVGDPYSKIKNERVEVKDEDVVPPNTDQTNQQQKKEKQQAVGGKNNEVKAEPDSAVANVYNGPVTVSDNASKGGPRKKKEKTQIKEKELAKKNVPDHVVEPASNGAGKKRKRKQKKKHQAVGDPINKVKIERDEAKAQGDVTPNTEQKKKQQQQKKEKQLAVGGKNNEVKAGPDSTVANVYNGPVTVSDNNASKGSLRKKKEKTQIKEKELAKKNVPDHVVEPASNGAGKKRKRKQKKTQEVANENAKTNFVEKGSSGTEEQIREGFEAATDSKTIVVSGLTFATKEKKIFDHFKDYGFITQIGRSTFSEGEKISGLVYIEFETEDAAKQAVGLDGTKLRDIFLKVELSKVRPKKKNPPAKISGCKIAYIGNLPRVVKEDDIRQFFKDSKIESINLGLYKSGSHSCRGFGHVLFADDESLENAIKKNTEKLYDRPIKVAYPTQKYAEPSKKKKKVQDV